MVNVGKYTIHGSYGYRNEKTRDIEISEDEPVDFTRFSLLATSRFLSFATWNLAEFCTLEQLGGRNVNRLVV